jgi:hypothetical protein
VEHEVGALVWSVLLEIAALRRQIAHAVALVRLVE